MDQTYTYKPFVLVSVLQDSINPCALNVNGIVMLRTATQLVCPQQENLSVGTQCGMSCGDNLSHCWPASCTSKKLHPLLGAKPLRRKHFTCVALQLTYLKCSAETPCHCLCCRAFSAGPRSQHDDMDFSGLHIFIPHAKHGPLLFPACILLSISACPYVSGNFQRCQIGIWLPSLTGRVPETQL